MAKELEKNYNPADIEKRTYDKWLEKKYFHAEVNRDKKPFTIVMPPPNITGQLHMGHALDNTLQDILIRFKRMQGYEALWVPGTDHASIATEAKVVEKLAKDGIRVNAVAPGTINTSLLQKTPEETLDKIKSRICWGQLGTPEEVANAYMFLASDLSSYISGQVLGVDGMMIN